MKEILKHLVENTTLPEDNYLEQDEEILEIFVEELEEIFEVLEPLLGLWMNNQGQDDALVNIRRYYHTLKGSGRMVGAKSSGELAWTVEDTLNRVIAKNLTLTTDVQRYINTVFNIYKFKLYDEFKQKKEHQLDLRPLVLLGLQIQQNQSVEPALEDLLQLSEKLNSTHVVTGLEIGSVDLVVEEATVSEVTDIQPIEEVAEPTVEESAEPVSVKTITPNTQLQAEVPANTFQYAEKDDGLLSETIAIFIEESEEHLQAITEFLQQDEHTADQYNRLIRALHTLRGSSSMVHIDDIFEASGKVEHLFKMLVQEDTESSFNESALLTHYSEFVGDYLYALKSDQISQTQTIEITKKFNDAWDHYGFQIEQAHDQIDSQDLVSRLVNLNIDQLLDADFEFDKRARAEPLSYFEQLIQQAELLIQNTNNRASQGIFEFSTGLKSAYEIVLSKPELLNTDYIFELFTTAHQEFLHLFDTLASGQRVSLSDQAHQVIQDLSDYVHQDLLNTEDAQPVFEKQNAVEEAVSDLVSVSDETTTVSLIQLVAQRIREDKKSFDSAESFRDFDEAIMEIFIEEADELLVGMDADLNTWSADLSSTSALNNLMRHLHTLKGGANMIQAEHVGWIAHELETIYERIIKNQMQPTPQLVQSIRLVQDDIADRLQILRDQGVDYPAEHIVDLLRNIDKQSTERKTIESIEQARSESAVVDQTVENLDIVELSADVVSHPLTSPIVDEVEGRHAETSVLAEDDEIDPVELIARETFFEEADELLNESELLLKQWFDERGNRSLLLQLQRIFHSLKGGAKMIHLDLVASIAYELENAFEQFAVHNFNSNAYDALLQTAEKWLKEAIKKQNYQHYDSLKHNLNNIQYVDVNVQLPNKLTRTDLLLDHSPVEFIQGDGTEPPSMFGEWSQSDQSNQNSEMIRISADLIEKMIDLSGENAINRSRIEMDLGQLGNTLIDMELAIKRLADQLRRMDGELESQIIVKHGDLGSRYADFDPLEMDQYSSLNQLSKSLAESASDLVDFKTTIAEKIRDTESLLLQQSRIQAEIQESLMRTRLVPFSRLLPRLQRLVRQTATTLNRPTDLIVNNTEGELDRTILEKLVSPLEHMLRNAIDHGIEEQDIRQQMNKPETGRIELNISRQGTDVIVEFSDDGKGIDAELIKAKAIEKGLIKKNQILSQEDILQYIFHSGFSTAQQVTQISGRGVGLDVVQSEIKSMGGQVTVQSTLGQGSVFTIRVPTTVAVSDALMVKVGDQQFAVPLSQIDRIVRISPTALEEFFESKEEFFGIDNQSYKLRYLAEFVSNQPVPRLQGVGHSLPVLLVKGSMGQSIALLVDQLVGSRSQIVVKAVGQQFSSIGAISGATIMGDGHVCLILDGQNIARQIQSTQRVKEVDQNRDQNRNRDQRRLVMIVDDSVTVRKVTSRLLERNGFDVITAKDGVDAIEQLESVKPDLMLLDIEMPRMDGFEVTNLVRHHEIHRDLPIIMITSRTGEKHRERAFSLGVTNYMGKPFQEAELLENIDALLTEQQEVH